MADTVDPQREKRAELILQQLDELPTLPAVAVRVLELTGSEDSSAKDVVQLIQSDIALTARILQLVHRADVGVRGEVSSVERAVILLGFEAVRSAVLALTVFDTLGAATKPANEKAGGAKFIREEFWKHAVATACCAELLAEGLVLTWGRDCGVSTSEAFVCGLLHDMGKVALDATLPKSFDRVVEAADLLRGNIADVERTVIGLDHMTVGKRLAEQWHLPATMRDAIWLHGQLPQALPSTVKNPRLVNLITLADILVREQHLGYSGNYTFTVPRQGLLDAIGLSTDHVETALRKLVERIEPRAKSLGLGQDTSNELYRQALTRANKELGRVTGQLAAKNRKLAIRAKFFDALSGFQGGLRPDAPPGEVLQAVGHTALDVIHVPVVGIFSLPPGQGFAETTLFNAGGVFDTTLIDCPPTGRPQRPGEGDGPVLAAGEDLAWLIDAISPRLFGELRYWICLEADGQCIGGVVWGAAAGESQRLSPQVQELAAVASGWALALRTAQIREEARTLSEQLADANRRLHNAQSEILRSRTMITVGEMAAGAAHEMNNPLAVISGRSQLLASQLDDPKLKASAKLIHEQSQRLSDIITELMHFAQPVPAKPADCDLGELVQTALSEAKAQAELADRLVEVTCGGDVPRVHVDPWQVGAAVAEVLTNAIQWTDPKAGRVEVTAAFDPYSSRVVMTVTDNGAGMDERTLKRAFDPFFSNQPAGRRRGMGLAKALRWLESNGGSIRLESRPNHGTRAILLMPAAATAAAGAGPSGGTGQPPAALSDMFRPTGS